MHRLPRLITTAALACTALLPAAVHAADSATAPTVRTLEPLTAAQLARTQIRVATVQIDGPWNWRVPTTPQNDPADPLLPYIARAGAEQADLIVFPELYLGMFRVPSPQTEKIAAAARQHRINVMVGCFEVLDDAGHYANSTLIFDREGRIVGRYFKAFQAVNDPPKPDDPEWMMTPGTETPVFDLDFGRIGVLTCYDGYFPEMFRLLALKGAEVIVWPNARSGAVEEHIVRSAMQANYVHLVTSNKAVGGGSMIAEWPARIDHRTTSTGEAYLSDTLNMGQLRTGRIHAREFFQRRAQMFAELGDDWQVWTQYQAPNRREDWVAPDVANRTALLKSLGIDVRPITLP